MLYIYTTHRGPVLSSHPNIGFHEVRCYFFSGKISLTGEFPAKHSPRPVTVVCVLWPYIAPVLVEVGIFHQPVSDPTKMTMRTKPGVPKRYEKVAFLSLFLWFLEVSTLIFLGLFQVMKRQTLGPWDDPFGSFEPPFVWNQPKPNLHHLLFVWKEWEGIFPFVVFGKEDLFSHSFIWGRRFQTFFWFFLFIWGLMKMRVVMVLMTRCFLLYSDRSYSDSSWYKISWTTFYTLQRKSTHI